jgi:hypothetical protein
MLSNRITEKASKKGFIKEFVSKYEVLDQLSKTEILKEVLSTADQRTLSIISCLVLPALKVDILVTIVAYSRAYYLVSWVSK